MSFKDPPSDILIVNDDRVLFSSGIGKLTNRPKIAATLAHFLNLFSQKIMKGEQHRFIRFDDHRMIFLTSKKSNFPHLVAVVLAPLHISAERVIPNMKIILNLIEEYLEGNIPQASVAQLDCFNRVINYPSQSIFLLPKTAEGIRSALVLLAGFAYDLQVEIERVPSRMFFVRKHDYLTFEKILEIPNLGVLSFVSLPDHLKEPSNKICVIGQPSTQREFFSALPGERPFHTFARILGSNSYASKMKELINNDEALEISGSIAELDKIYDAYVRNEILFSTIMNPGKDIVTTLSNHLLRKLHEITGETRKPSSINISSRERTMQSVEQKVEAPVLDQIQGFVSLKNINRIYKMGNQTIHALKNISLDLASGQLVVVLGPSGSGKTTLLNVIGGIDRCKGTIMVGDRNITKLNKRQLAKYRRTTCGFIFQFFNLLPVFSAQENVEYAVELTGIKSKKEVSTKAMEYLKAVGLYEKKHLFPSQMSGGEQQRVAAARAFAKEPQILLCDEPTGELSVNEGRQVLAVIQRLIRENPNVLVLLVTHNQKIAQIGDLVIRLRSGEIDSITQQVPIDAETLTW